MHRHKNAHNANQKWMESHPGHPGMPARLLHWALVFVVLASIGSVSAQRWRDRFDEDESPTPPPENQWKNPRGFEHDVFTFARVIYDSGSDDYGYFGRKWKIDWPDADWNFSYRLKEITALEVDPVGVKLRLTDERLADYPFIYMVEPGGILLNPAEIEALRAYLLNGGFMMVDDFWGDYEWDAFERAMKQVFPDRKIVDLTIEHEIFNTVFPLSETLGELPQIPNVGTGQQSQWDGVTWETRKGPGARDVHYRAIMDDQDRIMVMICHNTDLGDGWEREGEYEYFFREFSEKKAYPLGINIIFYAMTH